MTPGVTALSREIYGLHMLMFWWCVGIAVVVFGFMIYSMVRFRKSKGAVADTNLTHSTRVEVIWTIVPVLILISMAVPAARVLVQTEDASGCAARRSASPAISGSGATSTSAPASRSSPRWIAAATRRASCDSGIDPFTVPNYLLEVDHPLVVPAGVKVRLLITGQDVIHSWWVPAFAHQEGRHPGLHQ